MGCLQSGSDRSHCIFHRDAIEDEVHHVKCALLYAPLPEEKSIQSRNMVLYLT